MGNKPNKWGYTGPMNKIQAIRDIIFVTAPFIIALTLIRSNPDALAEIKDIGPGYLYFFCYAASALVAGVAFLFKIHSLGNAGCLLTLVMLLISPYIGLVFAPIMLIQGIKELIS